MPLDDVVLEKNHDSHCTEVRTVVSFFNNENDTYGLSPRQIRVVLIHKGGPSLGNHWREYAELYEVTGEATFILEDIDSKDKKEYILKTGDRIFIPSRIALRVSASQGTVLYSLSQEVKRDQLTHKYEVG